MEARTDIPQVVIVMDRMAAAEAEDFLIGGWTLLGKDGLRAAAGDLRAALDRDPDELVEQVARAISDGNDLDGWAWDRDTINGKLAREQYRKFAQAALHALQEGTEK